MKSMSGAPAQTKASWRQSRNAPRANDAKRPIWDKILEAEHKLPRIEGCAISEMYTCDDRERKSEK